MPDKDVVIRGTWGKVEVNKAADGTLREALTLYKQVEEDTKNETKFAKKYTGDTSNFLGNENIYYYYGKKRDF